MFLKLLLLFIGIPLIELILFYQIGSRIGLGATLATVVITGILGAWLTKQQGLRTLAKYQKAIAEGRLPHEEVIEGLMILGAGAVLLTPGFLTDAIGFSLLVPPIRAVVRELVTGYAKDRIQVVSAGGGMPGAARPASGTGAVSGKAKVIDIEAEVVGEVPPRGTGEKTHDG